MHIARIFMILNKVNAFMINIVLLYPDKSAKYPLGFHLQLFYFIF
jgi:hypothetical protein